MEIYSYIQNEKPEFKKTNFSKRFIKPKINLKKSFFLNKLKFQRNSDFFGEFSKNKTQYAVSLALNSKSYRIILAKIGKEITKLNEAVQKNLNKIFYFVFAVLFLIFGIYGIFEFSSYKINHTGPVEFDKNAFSDIESLDEFMAKFAMENAVEYDENGKLFDSKEIDVSKVFTMPVTFKEYVVKSGDTISGITKKSGLSNISTLISINNIQNVRKLSAGQKLKIPSVDGIIYTVKSGDSLEAIAKNNKITMEALLDVNELNSENLISGQSLFLPGVSLPSSTLRNAMGDKFSLPLKAKFRWTSPYGSRIDPIANVKSFHTGTDMAAVTGTPIYSAGYGTVSYTGVSRIYGNYVIVNHGNGYQTWYAHMSKITSKKGQIVDNNTQLGLVGSTGYSTGPHLHFSVYKNGKLVDPMSVLK